VAQDSFVGWLVVHCPSWSSVIHCSLIDCCCCHHPSFVLIGCLLSSIIIGHGCLCIMVVVVHCGCCPWWSLLLSIVVASWQSSVVVDSACMDNKMVLICSAGDHLSVHKVQTGHWADR